MIVDLLRNDIGRVAKIGSVAVPSLFQIERYPTVYQMTSTITAKLETGTTLGDVLAALFPCGSITGAPKVSTMQHIAQLEIAPRDVYCGTIGFVTPDREAVFNVAIRTMLLDTLRGTAVYGVGGGITWDSTAPDEYAEALAKADLLTYEQPSFELIESLRYQKGTFTLLERHIERMAASATYFDIPFDPALVSNTLSNYASKLPDGVWKIRLLVSQQGSVRVEHAPLTELPPEPLPVRLAQRPILRNNRFLYHKTTFRQPYNTAREHHHDVFDVLLWNEDGELTEFTIGNLVVELDGQLWTPARACSLLAGTLRDELIASGMIKERVLKLDDVQRASKLWLINSVRGWLQVYLASEPSLSSSNALGIEVNLTANSSS
jgi:para-aminobenzoate synthetase/4-amino-4-deoxychorismate lyase